MGNKQEAPLVLAVVVILAVLISGAIWSFSSAIGIDFAAGGTLVLCVFFACVLLGLGWWQENSDTGLITVRGVAPVAVALVWLGFWPALQQWGAIGPMFYGMTVETRPVEWWANAWTRWLTLAAILGGGYFALYRAREYY